VATLPQEDAQPASLLASVTRLTEDAVTVSPTLVAHGRYKLLLGMSTQS
jgi:hypothetical protein